MKTRENTAHHKRISLMRVFSHFGVSYSPTLFLNTCLFLFLTSLYTPAFAVDKKQQEAELHDVQAQINKTKNIIGTQKKARRQLEQELKSAEKDIADIAKALNTTRSTLDKKEQDIQALEKQQIELNTQKQQHQEALAKQLASAYMTGTHDYSKMLFNQQDPSSFERIITYYQYLNRARTDSIEKVKRIITSLETVEQQLHETREALLALEKEQQQQQASLVTSQTLRRNTIAQLRTTIANQQEQLTTLRDNEKALTDAIKRIKDLALKQIELAGLKHLKGKLNWPTRGKVYNRFGKRRQGRLTWKGIIIEGKEGTNITTIHHGQVLFADWLKGFGWVIVIDHGDGYMSLYGHNQTLLKSVGEKVEAGEPIALLGQSGGQDTAGLYFEVRHQGKAINPTRWFKR